MRHRVRNARAADSSLSMELLRHADWTASTLRSLRKQADTGASCSLRWATISPTASVGIARAIEPKPDAVWMPEGGQPVQGRLGHTPRPPDAIAQTAQREEVHV